MAVQLVLVATVFAAFAPSSPSTDITNEKWDDPKAIYGVDNRLDFFEADSEVRQMIRRVSVALITKDNLGKPDEFGRYPSPFESYTLRASQNLCRDQKFQNHTTAARCSGSLIGIDRVLTAGHCVSSCKNSPKFVFDYSYTTSNFTANVISEDDIYSCRRVYSIQIKTSLSYLDYAVVQLDRPVKYRTPVPIGNKVSLYQEVMMIGYPQGIPAKFVPSGTVTSGATRSDAFSVAIDSFQGNSGSPVFNSNWEVVGILVSGNQDLQKTGGCNTYATYSPLMTSAETVTHAKVPKRTVPECLVDSDCENSNSGPLCDRQCAPGVTCCTGWCGVISRPVSSDFDCSYLTNGTLDNDEFGPFRANDELPEEDYTLVIVILVLLIVLIICIICCIVACCCYYCNKNNTKNHVAPTSTAKASLLRNQVEIPATQRPVLSTTTTNTTTTTPYTGSTVATAGVANYNGVSRVNPVSLPPVAPVVSHGNDVDNDIPVAPIASLPPV